MSSISPTQQSNQPQPPEQDDRKWLTRSIVTTTIRSIGAIVTAAILYKLGFA